MKIYKKSECAMAAGQIIAGDEMLFVPPVIYSMFHLLDEQVQKAMYLKSQPAAQKAPSLDGFKKKTQYELPFVAKPATPKQDRQVKNALAIMAEIDAVNKAGEINGLILELKPLFDWVACEFVSDCGTQHPKFDLPVVGNPLELTQDKLVEFCQLVSDAAELEE